jgi:hypothetical protein
LYWYNYAIIVLHLHIHVLESLVYLERAVLASTDLDFFALPFDRIGYRLLGCGLGRFQVQYVFYVLLFVRTMAHHILLGCSQSCKLGGYLHIIPEIQPEWYPL